MWCATTSPERPDRSKPVSDFLDCDGRRMNRRRDRVFLSFVLSSHVHFRIFFFSLSFFLSISFYSDAIYHLRAYPKRTQHPLLNAALLFDKAWKGPICLASVCSIVGFLFLFTSFHSLLSSTSESFSIFSAIMFPPAFLQNTLF